MQSKDRDPGLVHNFATYTNSQGTPTLFRGEIITGEKTIWYTFKAPRTPGDYYFHGDVHLITSGTLKVD